MKQSDAPEKPTVEERLAAKKKRADVANTAAKNMEQAIKDRPNLEAEVAQAESNLADWKAAGSGFKADLRRKRQALSDCKQVMGEPVRVKKVPVEQPPAEVAAGAEGATSAQGGDGGE